MASSTTNSITTRARTRTSFFVYAGGSVKADEVADLAREAGGLIVRKDAGLALGRDARRGGFDGPVMVDPSLYEKPDGSDEYEGGSLFGDRNATWAAKQAEFGVSAYLSPSQYVPAGRHDVLADVLEQGERFCERLDGELAYVVLPIDASWLQQVSVLTDTAGSCRYPVALALGATHNPLQSKSNVRGLRSFLSSCPRTFLLRADVACIGALADGAAGVSYGTSSSVRHVWPPDRRSGGRRGEPAVLVPSLLRHVSVEKIEQLPNVDGIFVCHLGRCQGAPVTRFARPAYSRTDVAMHDLHVVRGISAQIAGSRDPVRAWRDLCARAVKLHSKVTGPGKVRLGSAPSHLSAWLVDI